MSTPPIVRDSVMKTTVKNSEQTSLSDSMEKEGLAAMTNSTISSAATNSAPSLPVNGDDLPSLDSLRGQMPGSPKATPTSPPALEAPSKLKTEEALAKAKQEALQALKRHGEIDTKFRQNPLCEKYLSAEVSMRSISVAVSNYHLNVYNYLSESEFLKMGIDEDCRKYPASKIKKFAEMPKQLSITYSMFFDGKTHGEAIKTKTSRFYSAWKDVFDSRTVLQLFVDQENIAQCKKDMEAYLNALPLERNYKFPDNVVSSLEKEIDAFGFPHYSTKFRLYEIVRQAAWDFFWSKQGLTEDSKTNKA